MRFTKKEEVINGFIETITAVEEADDVWKVGIKPLAKRVGLAIAGAALIAVGWNILVDNQDLEGQMYGAMKTAAKMKGGEF